MNTYKYRAKKSSGEIVEGKIKSQTEKDAIEKLSQQGYLPIRIEEDSGVDKSQATEQTEKPILNKAHYKIKFSQVTIFTRQMASLLKSGVPILKAISIISEQSEDPKFKNILREIYTAVKQGASFSSVLKQYKNVFSSLYIAMVNAGENSGALPEALLSVADYRIKQEEMLSRLRMVMVYPMFMALVGLGTVIFMLTFVLPRLMQMFLRMGQELPLPTRILIATSQGLCKWWFWIILILVVFILVVKRQLNTKAGKISLSLFKLHLPVFGKFILKSELARFSRTLELLIRNGIPILKALSIAIPVLENEIIKNQLRQSYVDLEKGSSFGKSLKNSKLIPIFMSNLIIVGEESGKLEEALKETVRTYEREVDEAIRVMGNLLEPVMILGMGLVIGFIVIAMLLPIFEINV